MELSNEQLIAEAIEINHAGIGKEKTLERIAIILSTSANTSLASSARPSMRPGASTSASSWGTLGRRAVSALTTPG
ncbi:MAG: hypothetical protein QOF13_2072 [Solirubrobacterales bacterium]|nr:hypothetical protein [Solirubrobacterales bacterium]